MFALSHQLFAGIMLTVLAVLIAVLVYEHVLVKGRNQRLAERLEVSRSELGLAQDAADDLLNFLRSPNVRGLKDEIRKAISRDISSSWELIIPERTNPEKESFTVRSEHWMEPDDQTKLSLTGGHAYLILPASETSKITEEMRIKLNGVAEWAEAALQLTRIAETDLQTGLASKNHTLDVLEALFERATSFYPNFNLSLVAFDIDDFKSVNDRNGHAAGDTVIERIARIMESHHRKDRGDVSGRTGKGDEFLFILPMVTKREAIQFAEAVRKDIAEQSFTSGRRSFGVTASFGVATYRESCKDYHQLLAAVDRALYRSKSRGRNCVSSAR